MEERGAEHGDGLEGGVGEGNDLAREGESSAENTAQTARFLEPSAWRQWFSTSFYKTSFHPYTNTPNRQRRTTAMNAGLGAARLSAQPLPSSCLSRKPPGTWARTLGEPLIQVVGPRGGGHPLGPRS